MFVVVSHWYMEISFYTVLLQPGFLSGSVVKNLPTMQETQETRVQSQGQEDSLEEGMATQSSILA